MTKTNKQKSVASHYQKVVFWSEEDRCFIVQCPTLFLGGVHGDDEMAVYKELAQVVEEHLAILRCDGKDMPASDRQAYSGKLTLRIKPEIHRALALRAGAMGDSLTGFIERTLQQSLN
jgi:predicted HicB family RNase H-like nuclease